MAVISGLPESGLRIREVQCKSILNRSGITTWTVNCYAGCEHACFYCYARFATRFSHPREPWGTFVDVKVNAAERLAHEVKKKPVGDVFVSSVCDGWQPLEARYGLTRQCLEILLHCGFPVTILTKSALARRDLDTLAGRASVEFGVTITTLDKDLSRLFEPRSSSPEERLQVAEEAKRRGIKTYLFLGPLMPYLSDMQESLSGLLRLVKEMGVDYFYVDQLNPRYGVWPSLKLLLQTYFPELVEKYRRLFFDPRSRMAYSTSLSSLVHTLARKQDLSDKMHLCF